MIYSQVFSRAEMLRSSMSFMLRRSMPFMLRSSMSIMLLRSMRKRVRPGAFLLVALFALQGCATYNPVTVFHNMEGGDPAKAPPPAPGLADPSPNLASVPPKPLAVSPAEQAAVFNRLQAANRGQHALAAPGGGVAPVATPVTAPAELPPLLVGFQPGRAIVPYRDAVALRGLAARRGAARIAAIGFAPAQTTPDLELALRRATAIADVLTAAGVPGAAIRIEALTTGRGGAAQLLYPTHS